MILETHLQTNVYDTGHVARSQDRHRFRGAGPARWLQSVVPHLPPPPLLTAQQARPAPHPEPRAPSQTSSDGVSQASPFLLTMKSARNGRSVLTPRKVSQDTGGKAGPRAARWEDALRPSSHTCMCTHTWDIPSTKTLSSVLTSKVKGRPPPPWSPPAPPGRIVCFYRLFLPGLLTAPWPAQ